MSTRHQSGREKGDRPYPWRCPTCGKCEVHPATVPYTAEIKHDGLAHSIYIPALETAKCRSCGELLITSNADDQINAALRARLRLLTPLQIRQRRKTLGLSQGELAERIGAAEGTISRWETGALIQSRTSDNLLRVYFASSAVRTMLIGKEQDPNLGLRDEHPAGQVDPDNASGKYQQFPQAMAAYGERELDVVISRFRNRGCLLPVGRR